MTKKYKTIKLPLPVYNNLQKYKQIQIQNVKRNTGKDIKLTTPKFLNALIIKDKTISPLIPFNTNHLYKLSKKRRGIYDLY